VLGSQGPWAETKYRTLQKMQLLPRTGNGSGTKLVGLPPRAFRTLGKSSQGFKREVTEKIYC
jgi:hypothetical protein